MRLIDHPVTTLAVTAAGGTILLGPPTAAAAITGGLVGVALLAVSALVRITLRPAPPRFDFGTEGADDLFDQVAFGSEDIALDDFTGIGGGNLPFGDDGDGADASADSGGSQTPTDGGDSGGGSGGGGSGGGGDSGGGGGGDSGSPSPQSPPSPQGPQKPRPAPPTGRKTPAKKHHHH